jgi:protein involved in polysaccharide export with SLBB domain
MLDVLLLSVLLVTEGSFDSRAFHLSFEVSSQDRTVYVIGMVREAGRYLFDPPMTVADAISQAGGVQPRGSRSGPDAQITLEIRRRTKEGLQLLKARMSDRLLPDDMVVVWRGERPKK